MGDLPSIDRQVQIDRTCQALVLRVFRDLDEFDYAGVVSCFAPDGVWLRAAGECRGREQIRAALEQRPRNQVVCHVVTNMLIDFPSSRSATMSAYNTVYRAEDPVALPATIPAPLGVWSLEAQLIEAPESRVDGEAQAWQIVLLKQRKLFSFPASS